MSSERHDQAGSGGIAVSTFTLPDGHRFRRHHHPTHQLAWAPRGLVTMRVDEQVWVLPRSRGGEDSWENLVTACRVCNLRKGWRTPDEAAMRLMRSPAPPRWSTTMQILLGSPNPFDEWDPFLKTA